MWKLLTPVLTGLSLLLVIPALASALPSPTALPAEGPIESLQITGRLHGEWIPDDSPRPGERFPDRPRLPIARLKKVWKVTAAGLTHELDFGTTKELFRLAEWLDGKTVTVTGVPRPGSQVLHVRTLKAAGTDPQTITVQIRGTLRDDPAEILRPFGVHWYLTAAGQRYYLDLGGDRRLEGLAETLRGTVEVTGRLEICRGFQVVHVQTLAAVAEALLERVYEGPSANYWQTEDTIFALKIGDCRPLVEHVRALLAEDLKAGGHSVRVEGSRLVVRTTAGNHARIRQFLDHLAMIPEPAR
jgi:hypothetical protein